MSKVIYEMVSKRFLDAMKDGCIPWQKPWQQIGGVPVLPANAVSKNQYNGINSQLLAIESFRKGYDLPVWITLRQANAAGGGITKGERSTPILFWKQWEVPTDSAAKIEDADKLVAPEKPEEDEEIRKNKTIPLLRYYSVFNADQTYGVKAIEALKERVKGFLSSRPFNAIDEAERLLKNGMLNLGCKLIERGNKAAYNPGSDYIFMPHRETFETPAHFYMVLFHEMVHATGHANRLSRSFATNGDTEMYAKEELVAEIGGCFLLNKCGLLTDGMFKNSNAYVQGWMKRIAEDPKLIVSASSQAMRAVEYVVHGKQESVEVAEEIDRASSEEAEAAEVQKV